MIELVWKVAPTGYKCEDLTAWNDRTPIFRRWLAPRRPDEKMQNYNTNEFPALFRTFAELPSDEEAIAEFAQSYGLLTRKEYQFLWVDAERNTHWVDCDPLDLWASESRDMQHVLRWEEQVRLANSDWLNKFLRYVPDGNVLLHELADSKGFGEMTIASQSHNTWVLEAFTAGRVLDAARVTLLCLLNTKIENHPIHIQLQARRGVRREADEAVGSVTRSWCDQSFVPDDLLGALWMQAVQAVHGVKGYRQCEQCGKWFELTEQRRADAKFCSHACRSRAYRGRIAHRAGEHTRSEGSTIAEAHRMG
jgi:hypothetical protein